MNDDMQHEPEAETYDPAFVRDLEAEVRHEDQLFAAHCAAMDASIADDCAPRPTGRPRVPDWANSRLTQQKLRQQKAAVLVVRNARLRSASLDMVLSRARTAAPRHSGHQHGAITRSTAKSGDSNDDDGDPDPYDVLIPDPAAGDARVAAYADPTQHHRHVRKAIAAMRLLNAGSATPRQQHAADFYVSRFTGIVRGFLAAPRFQRLGRDALDLAAPVIAIDALRKLAGKHDFQTTPNPNTKAMLSKNFGKVSDVASRVRAASTLGKPAAGLCVVDMIECGGKDVAEPEIRPDLLSMYDTHLVDKAMTKAEAALRAEAEAAGYTYVPAVRSSTFLQRAKDHNTARHFSDEYVSALRASDRPDDDEHVDRRDERDDDEHVDRRNKDDEEQPAFLPGEDDEEDYGDALEAKKAVDRAHRVVRYVLGQPDRQQAILDAALTLSELDDDRVLLFLSRDRENPEIAQEILALVGYEAPPLEPAEPEKAAPTLTLEEVLETIGQRPADQILSRRKVILSSLAEYLQKSSSSNLLSALKTRAENKFGKFSPEVQRVAHILWAKGGAA